jgi:hypothetical protein
MYSIFNSQAFERVVNSIRASIIQALVELQQTAIHLTRALYGWCMCGGVLQKRCDPAITDSFPPASLRYRATAGARIDVGPGWG